MILSISLDLAFAEQNDVDLLSKNQSGVTLQVQVIIIHSWNSRKNTNTHVLHIYKNI